MAARRSQWMQLRFVSTVALAILAGVLLWPASGPSTHPGDATAPSVVALRPPPLIGVAHAQGTQREGTNFLQAEAGISAYMNVGQPISLETVRSEYRTIERETADYIIGSVPVTGYGETEDVHLYAHRDGWLVAYYPADTPAGKIVDWKDYHEKQGASISTKFDKVLATMVGQIGAVFTLPTYYDFRFPDANRLMIIAEYRTDDDFAFSVEIPSDFTYYERSWSLYNVRDWSQWTLNDIVVKGSEGMGRGYNAQGTLSGAELVPNQKHRIMVDDHGGLVLVYREP